MPKTITCSMRFRLAVSVLVLFSATGCSLIPLGSTPSSTLVSAGPSLIEHPHLGLRADPTPRLIPEPALVAPDVEPIVDDLLASPMLRDPDFAAAVMRWVDHWTGPGQAWFPDYLQRMGSYEALVDSTLAVHQLPASLRYLPLIESGYNPSARSRASAVGLWQFMAPTARSFDMEVGAFVDERRNPFKSTAAAVEYLGRLHDSFGSWFVTLAAYNGGPSRARRILRQAAPLAPISDSLFWAHRDRWPRETQEFVPKLIGALIVAERPEAHGLTPPEPALPLEWDEVEVDGAAPLDVLAEAAETEAAELQRLNPELYRGFTPPGQTYPLRVPVGSAGSFAERYAELPEERRVTVVEHAIQSGETLSHIAERYGVRVADVRAANPGLRPRYLRIGTRLTIPILLAQGGGD